MVPECNTEFGFSMLGVQPRGRNYIQQSKSGGGGGG